MEMEILSKKSPHEEFLEIEKRDRLFSKITQQENILENGFKTTSFTRLLKNFNCYPEDSSISDSTEEKEFIDRVNKVIKSNFNLYEVKKLYWYFHMILDNSFTKCLNYVTEEFDNINEIVEVKDKEIDGLKERLEKVTDILF